MTDLHLNKLRPVDNSPDIITPHNIKQALQDRSHLTHHPNPLENLSIIDDILTNWLFLNGPHGRRFALWELLNDLITHQLSTYRSAMGICPQPCDSTRKSAFAAIRQDVQTENRHLIAWSWLYYGYIRVDLNITQENYAQESHFDNRTIRRYQAAAFSAMAEILIQRERVARKSSGWASQTILKHPFTESELSIVLSPFTILELLRADKSLTDTFLKLIEMQISSKTA